MNQAGVNARVAAGLVRAAAVLGSTFSLYRPTGSMDPLLPGTSIGVVCCAVDKDGALEFRSPIPPAKPFGLLIASPDVVVSGDYLIGADTYFISRRMPFQPAWCVLCNGIFDVLETNQTTSAGANLYGGVVGSSNTLLARGWPMSILSKSRSGPEITSLPSDIRLAFFEILMPMIPGLTLGPGLCLRDNVLQTYPVMSYEVTDYGCRLLVSLATT